jgi:hypothetical protein
MSSDVSIMFDDPTVAGFDAALNAMQNLGQIYSSMR